MSPDWETTDPCQEDIVEAVLAATMPAPLVVDAAVGRSFAAVADMPSDLPPNSRCAVLIGRTLAACFHPMPAWRYPARSFRVLLLAGYFAAGYATGLTVLVLMN